MTMGDKWLSTKGMKKRHLWDGNYLFAAACGIVSNATKAAEAFKPRCKNCERTRYAKGRRH